MNEHIQAIAEALLLEEHRFPMACSFVDVFTVQKIIEMEGNFV